jgi:hypothetical protein
MKFNYKKIASVFASAVMLSSTIGFAAAAAYPAPFVKSGAADVAIVYGSAAAASVDMTNAVDIVKKDLDPKVTVTSGTATVTGENYQIKKSSTAFNLGLGVRDVVSGTVTNDNLPTMLKAGTFTDDDNDDFEYTQKLSLANLTYNMFEDSDYKSDTPTTGIKVTSGANVLNYSLEFTTSPLWADMATAELEMLGKSYYILAATANSSLTFLDAAEKVTIKEGEAQTVTVGSKVYSIQIESLSGTASSPGVKFIVDGKTTNKLNAGETQKLSDGAYLGVREINMRDVAGTTGSAEVSIGSGKLKLVSGSLVELNDDSVTGLTGNISTTSDAKISKIMLIWATDKDEFAADGASITLPGFKSIKLSYGGMTTAANEKIAVKNNGNYRIELNKFPLKDSTETIPLIYGNSTGQFTGIGSEATKTLRTSTTVEIDFDADTDEQFVASWTDGKDAESYLSTATFSYSDSTNKTTIKYRKNGAWEEAKKDAKAGDTITIGNVELVVNTIDYSGKLVNLTRGNANTRFNTLYTKEGLEVFLPYIAASGEALSSSPGAINFSNTTAGHNNVTFDIVFSGEDKNENKGAGKNVTVRVGWTSTPKVQVTTISGGSGTDTEIGSTETYVNYAYAPVAIKYEYEQSGDQDTTTITYFGQEAFGNFFLTASSASVGGDSSIKVFKDTDNASFKDMNLIVVGGSCVNQVAVKLLGGTDVMCGEAFTAATTVGAGKYLIKTFTSPYNAAKVATLVAGYNAEDTKAALSKLITGVDTEVGKQEIGPALS